MSDRTSDRSDTPTETERSETADEQPTRDREVPPRDHDGQRADTDDRGRTDGRTRRTAPDERERRTPQETGGTTGSDGTDVLGERIAAELIDNTVLFVLYFGVTIVFGGLSIVASGASEAAGTGGLLVTFFLAPVSLFLYNFGLEGWWNGQTLGKKALGLKVVQEDGRPVTPLKAGIRAIPIFVAVLGSIGAFIFAFQLAVGLAVMAVTDENQRLFDMLAGTVVVDENAV